MNYVILDRQDFIIKKAKQKYKKPIFSNWHGGGALSFIEDDTDDVLHLIRSIQFINCV